MAKTLDRAAHYRRGQGQHSVGAPEPHGRFVNQPPSGGIDLDRLPSVVAEIEIDLPVPCAYADKDLPLIAVEIRLGLNYVER